MKSDARWRLMGGLGIGAGVCGVHAVMYSGSEVGSGYGRGSELYGCVGGGRVGAVP